MGHKHCNHVTKADKGFMVGGAGMGNEENDCGGEFGFTILDTTDGKVRVFYFPVAKSGVFDHYNKILNCIETNGVSGCYHLAEKWSDTTL